MTPRRRIHASDDGAMLVIALLIITVVAIVTGALLTLSGGKFLATVNLRKVAATAYASDAAAKLAINDLVLGSKAGALASGATYPSAVNPSAYPNGWVFDNNIDGTGCFGIDSTNKPLTQITMHSVYTDSQSGTTSTATVTCTPVTGTGVFGSAGTISSSDNGEGRSITILGANGLSVNPQGSGNNAQFQVHGDVASRGPITVGHGFLYTNGAVTASSCVPSTIISSPTSTQSTTPLCSASAGAAVDDPYATAAPPLTTVPSQLGLAALSGCTFQPGYYDDANALTAATNACATSVFAPGVYYFDFHNNSSDPTYANGYAMSGAVSGCGGIDVWCIKNTVIGGVLSTRSTIPGACLNPIDTTGNGGVQFVFGGDSQMLLGNSAQVELCAPYNGGNPPMAIFGLDGSANRGALSASYQNGLLQTNNTTSASVTPSTSGSTSDWTASSGTLASALSAVGGATAQFSSASGNVTPTLTLSNFSAASSIPQGAILQSAKLQITHVETETGPSNKNNIAPTLTFKVGSGTATNQSTSLTNTSTMTTPTMTTDSIDETQALAAYIHSGTLPSLQVVFGENSKGKTNATVDAVVLVLKYYQPTLRGETTTAIPGNCVAGLSCNVIGTNSGSSFGGAFVVQGVTYLPSGAIFASLGNQTSVIALRWGLVANTATLGSLNQFPFAYPVVSIPSSGPGFEATTTMVDLNVYLCSDSGPCSTTGTPALTSRVAFLDGTSNGLVNPVAGQRKVTVLSWAEQK